MDVSIRRKALRHAAKVAFGTLVIGCGGTEDTIAPDAQVDGAKKDAQLQQDVFQQDAQDEPIVLTDGGLACTGPVGLDAGASITEQTFQCCLGVVEQIISDASFVVVDAGEVTGDPSIANCCTAVIAHVDAVTTDYGAASAVLPSCCNALGYPLGPACTPWGPPTPPSMEVV